MLPLSTALQGRVNTVRRVVNLDRYGGCILW